MRQGLDRVTESFERTKELFIPDAKGRQLAYMLSVNAEVGETTHVKGAVSKFGRPISYLALGPRSLLLLMSSLAHKGKPS